jgi:hypothetical protein
MNKKLQELEYIVLPGKFPMDIYAQKLHNQAFQFWEDFWNRVFAEIHMDRRVSSDNFWRQDMVTLLMHKGEIVGQHLYSFFSMDSLATLKHTYAKQSFHPEFFETLKQRKIVSLMSIEFLAVADRWRKKHSGVSLASVLVGLACQQQKHYNIDALIAPTRAKLKITELLIEHGGEIIVAGTQLHGEPADEMIIAKSKPPQDTKVQFLIRKLWNQRQDLTQDLPLIVRKKSA